jgi:hypothetical protein
MSLNLAQVHKNLTTRPSKGHSGGKPRNVVDQRSFGFFDCSGQALISKGGAKKVRNFVPDPGNEKGEILQ